MLSDSVFSARDTEIYSKALDDWILHMAIFARAEGENTDVADSRL